MAGAVSRIEPFDRDIALILSEELSDEVRSANLAAFAREQIAEAARVNEAALGYVPHHETWVDQVQGAPLETVRPDGVIAAEFELLDDVFTYISEALVRHSPVKSGRFTDSHRLYADGVEVDPAAAVPPAAEYVFTNLQPYARKIEGTPTRPPQSPQAPDGVFEAVTAMASRRFGNVARIRFTFRAVLGGAIDRWAGATKASSKGHAAGAEKRAEWLRRQPAIVITLR